MAIEVTGYRQGANGVEATRHTQEFKSSTSSITERQGTEPKDVQRSGEQGVNVQEAVASTEKIQQAVEELNQGTQLANKQLRFSVHDESDRMMVQVVDSETQEVIKELPPEKVLEAAAKIKEFIGLLLDERV